jgi:hypothetical protein
MNRLSLQSSNSILLKETENSYISRDACKILDKWTALICLPKTSGEYETNRLFLLVPRSRMTGARPPFPQYFFMVWCLVKHRDKFTFTFFICMSNTWRIFDQSVALTYMSRGLENLRLIGSSCINAKGRLENFRLAGSSYLYVKGPGEFEANR